MRKKNWLKSFRLNIHAPGTGIALTVLALTQIPVAIKTTAELACIGEVSNSEHALRSLGKAGASRWRGRRPRVRGVAMNPVDHPHGGGEGRTSGGRHPVSPTGVPAKGYKTRKNKRTNKMIIRDRRKK